MVGLDKINLDIPKKCILQIIDILIREPKWSFGLDKPEDISSDFYDGLLNGKKQDMGFTYCTYNETTNLRDNNNLNVYADLIFQTIAEKIDYLLNKKILRVYWNYYTPNSSTSFHIDAHYENYFSIIYNLHNNDGGTELILDNQSHIVRSKENEAIIFKSDTKHRGLAPKESSCRFSLNIVVK